MAQENEEKKEDGNAGEASTEAKSSENKIHKSLKARSKIAKKSPVNDFERTLSIYVWQARKLKENERKYINEQLDNILIIRSERITQLFICKESSLLHLLVICYTHMKNA